MAHVAFHWNPWKRCFSEREPYKRWIIWSLSFDCYC